jgi:hypothetical protein
MIVFIESDHISFKSDFPDIILARINRKKKIAEEELKRQQQIAKLVRSVYFRLVLVCSDLAFGRRTVRMGFNKWLEGIGQVSKAMVVSPKEAGLKKTTSKYRSVDMNHQQSPNDHARNLLRFLSVKLLCVSTFFDITPIDI